MSDPITQEEKQKLRDILERFYGTTAQRWTITSRSFELLGDLIQETRACDSAMNMVPRPFGGGNAIRWGSKQVRQAVLRAFNGRSGNHYISCMKAAAMKMRSAFEMAQHGM